MVNTTPPHTPSPKIGGELPSNRGAAGTVPGNGASTAGGPSVRRRQVSIPRRPSERSSSRWRRVVKYVGVILIVVVFLTGIGYLVTPWQSGRPLAFTSAAAHKLAAAKQARKYQAEFSGSLTEVQANFQSVPVVTNAKNTVAALEQTVAKWSPPSPVSQVVPYLEAEMHAAVTYLGILQSADLANGVTYSGAQAALAELRQAESAAQNALNADAVVGG